MMRICHLALAAGVSLSASAAHAEGCPDGFSKFDTAGDALGCVRPVPGSSYREYVVLVPVAAPPERVIEVAWKRTLDGIVDGLKHRDFIVREPRRIVFYDQIKTPVVSDRDYTCEAVRPPDDPSGRREIRFQSRNDLGPALDPHYTRIPALRAAWIAEPDGRGGTALRYLSYSEPGGSVPAFMVRGAQARHAMADVQQLVRAVAAAPR
jgi:hypothetical protein